LNHYLILQPHLLLTFDPKMNLQVAMLAVLVYEYLVTIREELRHIWRYVQDLPLFFSAFLALYTYLDDVKKTV